MPDKTDKPTLPLTPQIVAPAAQPLSKLQALFNKKVKQVERMKNDLVTKQESVAEVRSRIEKELKPISVKVLNLQVEMLHVLDEAYALPFFRKREKQNLAYFISDMAFDLIDKFGRTDLLPLHDKYADMTFEEAVAQEDEEIKMFTEQLFGDMFEFETGIDDADTLEAQLDKEIEQREQEKQARQKKRKTKAQQAKEEKAKAEMQNISKASRRIYTELAKQLHPDVEQNPTERTWKEEAMKRVTYAYKHDDFFELLRLQAEFMHHNNENLHQLPEDQLKYYNKILQDQIRELDMKLASFSYSPEGELLYRFGGTPKQIDKKFKQAKEDLERELAYLQATVRALHDPHHIRQMLKEM